MRRTSLTAAWPASIMPAWILPVALCQVVALGCCLGEALIHCMGCPIKVGPATMVNYNTPSGAPRQPQSPDSHYCTTQPQAFGELSFSADLPVEGQGCGRTSAQFDSARQPSMKVMLPRQPPVPSSPLVQQHNKARKLSIIAHSHTIARSKRQTYHFALLHPLGERQDER